MFFDRIAVTGAARSDMLVKVRTALATRDWQRKRPPKNHAITNTPSLKSIRKNASVETCEFDGSKRMVYGSAISALT